jgi:uncharacterized protein (TIGR02231 family)
MRHLLLTVALLPLPLQAETYEVSGHVEAVTLYPWGATVTRSVGVTVGEGRHVLIVPGLPEDVPAESLRVKAGEGAFLGAVSLSSGRLPVTGEHKRPEVVTAEGMVEQLEIALREKEDAVAAVRAKAEAARDQVAFLAGLGRDGLPESAEALSALVAALGAESLAARQAAILAEAEAAEADRALKADREALDDARQALAALTAERGPETVLTLSFEARVDGPVRFEIESQADGSWTPVYDLDLASIRPGTVTMERAAMIRQDSGEDWLGVRLTLSTARPAGQSEPARLWPWLRRIESEEARAKLYASEGAGVGLAEPVMEAGVAEALVLDSTAAVQTYSYPAPVDLRTGVDALRLSLDTRVLAAEVRAVAVPLLDETAFRSAKIVNDGDELILPGPVLLRLDGQPVGETELAMMPAGAEAEIGFGPIDGLRLARRDPNRAEGDEGIFTKSNRLEEATLITVENLTGEDWPVRVLDRIPYSEQDDLKIGYIAAPPATETDVDGQRGILAWDFDLKAGTSQEISLDQTINWPGGFVLE